MKNKKLVYLGVGKEYSIDTAVNNYITNHPEEDVVQVIVKKSVANSCMFVTWVLVEWESQF